MESLDITLNFYFIIITICFIDHSNNLQMYIKDDRIGGAMVSVLASSAVDRGFEPLSSQTKDYKISICSFSAKHAALKRKSKHWLARNKDNVSEWSDMSTADCCFSELAL